MVKFLNNIFRAGIPAASGNRIVRQDDYTGKSRIYGIRRGSAPNTAISPTTDTRDCAYRRFSGTGWNIRTGTH